MEKSKLITYIIIMNKKLLCLVVALVAMFGCLGSVQAQNWKWVSQQPAAGSFYLYNPANKMFLKATSTVTENINEATLFTLSAATNCTISYEDNGTKYVYESAGNQSWGTTNTNKWTIAENNGGYYIFHKDPNKNGRNRYINCNGNSINYPYQNFNDDNRTWIFVTANETELASYNRYSTAWNSLKPIYDANVGVQEVSVAINREANFSNVNEITETLEGLVDKYTKVGATFKNPLSHNDMADPSVILADDGYYYLYCTEHQAGEGISVYQSADMITWNKVTNVFPTGDRPSEVGYTFLWAPEIAKIGGKYVLYFANAAWGEQKKTQICVATSDKPYGPFEYKGVLFSATGENGTLSANVENCIDPSLFVDGDKKYMVWGSWHGIWYWELTEDGLSVTGSKKQIATTGALNGDWTKIEAPMIKKHGDYYYLIASKGSTVNTDASNIDYRLVVARGKALGGDFQVQEASFLNDGYAFHNNNNMRGLLNGNDYVLGPGHCSQIVTDKNGCEWIFYHGYAKDASGNWNLDSGRVLFASKVWWDHWGEGWPGILPPEADHQLIVPNVDAPINIYTRTGLAVGEYYTICLPYASAEKTGATFYSVNSVQKIDGEITGVYLDQLEDDEQLEKGVPYVFLANEETVTITCTGVPFVGYEGTALGLVGNLKAEKIQVPEGKYFMNTANTIAMTTDKVKAKIAENRAYFDLDDVPEYSAAGAGAKTVFFGLSGSATGIDAVNAGNEMSGAVYNIMGQRVGAGAKGLLIKNGKKIFVK